MTVVALTDRRGKELRVSEDAVEFWLGRGYKRIPVVTKPEPTPMPKRAPAKRK